MAKKMTVRLLPLFGFLFLSAYLRSAAVNVVYTDYIRLVNSYLEDVWSIQPYLRPDVLTRIPANYVQRIVNVELFHYSTMFDMMLGAFFLALSTLPLGIYCVKKKLPTSLCAGLILFFFSLNKWEMLTNGSGWVHFTAFALFWYHYLVYDRVMAGEGSRRDERRLLWLPSVTILLFCGPYCGVYAVTLILADLFAVFVMKKNRRQAVKRMLGALLPLLLFLCSRAAAVEERAGATTASIGQVVGEHPLLLPRFFVRSFASMVLGSETAAEYGIPSPVMTMLGLLVLGFYGFAFYLNGKKKIYRESVFPLLLLTAGFLNHVLVTASRWIFLNADYGMSSRYALQYQIGIVGILLTLFLAARGEGRFGKRLAVWFALLIFAGNAVTTGREIRMAKYRREQFLRIRESALHFEALSDAELKKALQYHDPVRIRKALSLLKERGLNVYNE